MPFYIIPYHTIPYHTKEVFFKYFLIRNEIQSNQISPKMIVKSAVPSPMQLKLMALNEPHAAVMATPFWVNASDTVATPGNTAVLRCDVTPRGAARVTSWLRDGGHVMKAGGSGGSRCSPVT